VTRDPVQRLARAAEEAMGDDPKAITFVQGLALGALVGAAIAGSTIWQRRHAKPALSAPAASDDDSVIVVGQPNRN
jgi:hypothetical protein